MLLGCQQPAAVLRCSTAGEAYFAQIPAKNFEESLCAECFIVLPNGRPSTDAQGLQV